jgi:mRNA-degrading endonuclease RelE of RelBE toxin-antitoxin system
MPKNEGAGSSPNYRVFETRQFLSDLGKTGGAKHAQLEAKLRTDVYPLLSDEPHSGPNIKRLTNWDPPTWRYRVGAWRFFYEIDAERRIVFMIACQHRKEAYR